MSLPQLVTGMVKRPTYISCRLNVRSLKRGAHIEHGNLKCFCTFVEPCRCFKCFDALNTINSVHLYSVYLRVNRPGFQTYHLLSLSADVSND